MKKVVLLAPYFLPRRRVGSWRPFKFAIHLKEFGWEPHVITIKDSTGTLTEKEQRLLAGIDVYEIEPPFDFTRQSGSQMKKKQTTEKSSSLSNVFDPALQWVDKNFPIDTWLPLFLLRLKWVEHVIEDIDPLVLWSTGDPWSAHWLAKKLARKKELPWVADFRDPWTLGTVNLKKRSKWSAKFDEKAERAVVNEASVVTFTSQSTEKLYKNHYRSLNSRTATIYNCFDRDLYNLPKQNDELFDDQYLNLLFFGKFRRLSPARPLIDILAELQEKTGQDVPPIRIHSFGELSNEDSAYAERRGLMQCFVTHNPIPGEEALSVLPQADVLWLSTDPDRTIIIPAKLWDYLAAEKPILSIAPNPEIGTILQETGAGLQINPTKTGEIAGLLQQSILAKQQGKPLPVPASFNKEKINQYEATQTTKQLAHIFDQLA